MLTFVLRRCLSRVGGVHRTRLCSSSTPKPPSPPPQTTSFSSYSHQSSPPLEKCGDYAAKPSKSMVARGGKKENEHLCKLFVGGLDPSTTEDTLQAHFENYGEIVDVNIVMDPETLNSRGYGFITFSESYVVDEALKHLPHNIYGKDIDAERALPRKKLFVGGIKDLTEDENEHLCKLFVGGLDPRTTEDTLQAHFENYGDIVDVYIVKDPKTLNSRGYGFIIFSESYVVDEVLKHLPHNIYGKDINAERALPRGQNQKSKPESPQTKKLFVGGIKDLTEDVIVIANDVEVLSNETPAKDNGSGYLQGF